MKMQTRNRKRLALAVAVGLMTPLAVGLVPAAADEQWVKSTSLYEEDAWYDVSEWADGNDYNPTDEAIGRWDDEAYDVGDAVTASDQDNDINWADANYGYYADNDDDWFYDYYDYGYTDYQDYDADDDFDYTAQYYDYDDDGVYDAFASYSDTDGDGLYEDMNYYSFTSNDTSDNAETSDSRSESMADAKERQKSQQSTMTVVSGDVQKAKKVTTPNGTNLVVHLKDASQNESLLVDLGPASEFEVMPRLGQKLTAKGVKFQAGDKTVLLAHKLMRNDVEVNVNRSGREYTGTIDKVKTASVRGQQHQLAVITTDKGKKLLVDMGPSDSLKVDIGEGTQVTVQGPAVKINGRLMLIANQAEIGGDTIDIQRMAMN